MGIDVKYSLVIIAVAALGTFFTRALPFLIFGSKEPPKVILYIGRHLPSAVIAILVVYCLGGDEVSIHSLLPKLIAGAAVVLLHIRKRNNLLSIGLGTIIYMILVQTVFV